MKLPRFIYHTKKKNGFVTTKILRIFSFKRKMRYEEYFEWPSWLKRPQIKNCGRNTYCGSNVSIPNHEETSIGAFCSLGHSIDIGHGVHPTHVLTTSPFFYNRECRWMLPDSPDYPHLWSQKILPVHIGSDVWIGNGVFIKNGINIGHGAIVGAHSVVTKDVPPYAIVAGNPAKLIRYRFSEDIIEKLLELKWWELDDDFLRLLPFEDMQKCISMLEQKRQKL
ncbi:MAG: CatB-related O-acetyltransferase [Akkermansia sp.]|nr:CatB-related O-acetyltransferase [Akkermansia sp.]